MTARLFAVAAAALLIGAAIPAQAENNTMSPGHKMQTRGSVKGHPGASGYAPVHVMQERGSKKGFPGASGYAPGRSGTTGSSR